MAKKERKVESYQNLTYAIFLAVGMILIAVEIWWGWIVLGLLLITQIYLSFKKK